LGFDPFLGKLDHDAGLVSWGAALLIAFISLGLVAIFKKSTKLAILFDVLLVISISIVVIQFFVRLNDPHTRLSL